VQVLLEKLPPTPPWAVALAENLAALRPTPLAVVWRAPDGTPLGTRLAAEPLTFLFATPTAERGIFFDTVASPTSLAIFGAGDDAAPLMRLAHELGWRVTVADPRPSFATAARFPGAAALVVAPAAQLVSRVDPPAGSLAVVMTHHYVHDVPLLRDLLPRPLAYLGLLGPKKRAERIIADLAGDGLILSPAQHARLHAPVGLDLGAENPEEVALSMIAEMRAALAGRDARPLRDRTRPIHA
jgi:xanthine/CO dehydrogenase XdhC/CoxF family maturation factor